MDELLKQWHVPQATIDAFVRNDITPEQLKYLNEEYLKELCPVLSTRIQIKKKIDEFLEAQAVTETATSANEVGELAEIAIPSDHCQDISFSIGDIFTPKASTKDFDLKTLLETSPCGKSVLQYYMANNRLDKLYKDDIEWLESNDEPWNDVINKWNSTAEVRHGREYANVQDFISHWKILTNAKAAELIDEDFNFLYPGKGKQFDSNWQNFINNLISLKKHEILADETKENLMAALNYMETSDELKIPTQLKLLVSVVPPKGRGSKKNKWSTQECLESIMIIIQQTGDIDTVISKQKERAIKQKLQVQPYLIILGSLQDIRQVYLIVDELRYTFESVQRAFDTLFKCYHDLNAKFPKASEHVHLIIQRCVYYITTKFDNPVPYISDILGLAD